MVKSIIYDMTCHICRLVADLGDAVFTYLKSKFMTITDHMARRVTIIGCLSRSHYCGTNQSFITWPLYNLYLQSGKRSDRGILQMTLVWRFLHGMDPFATSDVVDNDLRTKHIGEIHQGPIGHGHVSCLLVILCLFLHF